MAPPCPPTLEGPMSTAREVTPLVSKTTTDALHMEYGSENGNGNDISLSLIEALSNVPKHHAIGFAGSLAIAVNSLTGPAMVNLPATFQRSGLIPTSVTLVFVCILSSLCSLHMANTISKVPGNASFKQEVEFSEAFRRFWGDRWFVVTQVIFFLCIMCLNVSSIVDTAQVVDTFVGHWSPTGSAAVQFLSSGIHIVYWDPYGCTQEEMFAGECIPFMQTEGLFLSLGYVVIILVFLPLALMDLKENAAWQLAGFVVLLVTSVQFVFEFLQSGLDPEKLSLWGDSWDTLFGVVLFNFPLVIAIPAWLYEKEPSVGVPTVVYTSSILSAVLYIVIGSLGALAITHVSDNMLESMMSGVFGTRMQLGASVFAFFIIGLGIPLFSVLTRMSLTGSGLCSHFTGNALAVFLPFSVSWMFYKGDAITQLLAWGGVLFTSAVAFVLPLLLALHTVLEFDVDGVISVYGGRFKSRRAQTIALMVLLGLAVVSVTLAIVGKIFLGDP